MKKFRHDDDKGFILLEILAGLIVIGIATPLIYSEIENWLNEQLYQSAASHADAYNTAARNYIADNNATLHNGSLPANFTADDLIRKGYLKQDLIVLRLGRVISRVSAVTRLQDVLKP